MYKDRQNIAWSFTAPAVYEKLSGSPVIRDFLLKEMQQLLASEFISTEEVIEKFEYFMMENQILLVDLIEQFEKQLMTEAALQLATLLLDIGTRYQEDASQAVALIIMGENDVSADKQFYEKGREQLLQAQAIQAMYPNTLTEQY